MITVAEFLKQLEAEGRLPTDREAEVFFEPTYRPADDTTEDMVIHIAEHLDLSISTPARKEKVLVVLSSLLAASARLKLKAEKPNLIGWSHDNSRWSAYPAVGKDIVNEVRGAIVTHGWLTLHAEAKFKQTMTTYRVAERVFSYEGRFTQSELPLVTVKTPTSKHRATGFVFGGDRLNPRDAKKLFGGDLRKVEDDVKALNRIWAKHPLQISGNTFCAATRKFNDSRLDRGGRFYGGWTNLPEEERLTGTIDGEPVTEIDIRAANLTILTGLKGYDMPDDPFDDPYSSVKADREQAKAVVLELLGAGNAEKRRGSDRFIAEYGERTFVPVRDKLIEAYPALEHLEPNELDSNALAYEEAEIVLATLKALAKSGVVAYPMHDALICRTMDEADAVEALQRAFHRRVGFVPALKIQRASGTETMEGGKKTSTIPRGTA